MRTPHHLNALCQTASRTLAGRSLRTLKQTLSTRLLTGLVLGAGLAIVAGVPPADHLPSLQLYAQARGPVQRTVHGKVTDKSGNALKGAIVYLQDEHSTSVRTAIADDNGEYRFVQLAQNTDYTLWAKVDDKRSKNLAISAFDSRNDYVLNPKIDM